MSETQPACGAVGLPVAPQKPPARMAPPAVAGQGARPRPIRAAVPLQQAAPERLVVESAAGTSWYAAVPGRVWFAARIVLAPLAVAGWVLDKAVSALVVGVAALLGIVTKAGIL